MTHMGCVVGEAARLQKFADTFPECGLEADVSDGVQKMIWNKLFTNVSASALTGALQVPLGYISSNEHAWKLCCQLIREAVDASLDANVRTPEIQVEGGAKYGTKEVGAWIVDYIINN